MEHCAFKCSHCGTLLEEGDCYDTAFYDDMAIRYIQGYCPSCQKEYQWKEYYDFSGYDELVEV